VPSSDTVGPSVKATVAAIDTDRSGVNSAQAEGKGNEMIVIKTASLFIFIFPIINGLSIIPSNDSYAS
jgi:hypothetical protein